ncbi:GNAT family N-acetyltransferase [Legionella sp. PC997]|uniref:GNAT family N-acetyltransferase n=1 Tax=Legionella sp. PC997 TaxID=2755562 RepID=UPI0015FD3980|nr:GNAT family N-acetyltransferase [Legionella sp. PC997]QMT59174.1 acetyltransferase [Legionella sp. PC997]
MNFFKKLSFEDESELESFLSRYPETSMFLRSNLRNSGIEYKSNIPYHGEYFSYCNSLGEIQGVVAHYWNGNIMMQCPDLTALKELFHYFKSHCSRPICGILGDEIQAKIVIDLLEINSSSFALNATDGLYQLLVSEMRVPNSVYQLKKAKHCAPDIVKRWLTDYHVEALGADLSNLSDVESINNSIKEASNRDDLWILEDDGLPLSLCGFNASLPDIVQIGPVWTPVEYRNHGYARAVVALCLLEAQKNGVKQAILFTNNLAAERAYFSIGFKKIGEYRLAILRDKISN